MAKSVGFVAKPKKQEKIVTTCNTVTGKSGDKTYILSYSPNSKRFSLKCDDKLIVSSFFYDCLNRASELNVVWDETPELVSKVVK